MWTYKDTLSSYPSTTPSTTFEYTSSFRTTNCIENVNSLLEQLTHNVRRWTNSSQRHRWVATALLDIEPRLRRVKGYRHLPMLRQAIQAELGIKQLAMMG